MKTFYLQRDIDESGVSGTGKVAEGVIFSSGKCALSWFGMVNSIGIYGSIEEVEKIHGHGGKTKVVLTPDYEEMYNDIRYEEHHCWDCGCFE